MTTPPTDTEPPTETTTPTDEETPTETATPTPEHFVETAGTDFVVDGDPVYLSGTNAAIMNKNASRDNVAELTADSAAMGLEVVRTWAFCSGHPDADHCLQPGPGEHSEAGLRHLDYVIQQAKEHDVRLILPLVNNWEALGGMIQYVDWVTDEAFDSKLHKHDAFFRNDDAQALYRNHIETILTRENTYSGIEYRNDPTILMWELANEPRLGVSEKLDNLQIMQDWIDETAAFIKDIDSNHLVSTGSSGFYRPDRYEYDGHLFFRQDEWTGTDFIRNHTGPAIDACSFHYHIPPAENDPAVIDEIIRKADLWVEDHVRDAHETVGKPVYLGEFGVGVVRKDSTEAAQEAAMGRRNDIYETIYDVLDRTGGNAALFWQLEPRNPTGNLSYEDDPAGQPKAVYYPEDEETVDIIESFSQRMDGKSTGRV